MDASYYIGYIIGGLIGAVIWGFVAKAINENKGYDGGFAWGFWLGVIGVIVVAVRPENRSYSSYHSSGSEYDNALSIAAKEADEKRLLREGGWKCARCRKVNPGYVTTCLCGVSVQESRKMYEEQSKPAPKTNPADEIARFKKLLDDGAITEEEFAAKKKQLLGL